MYERLSKVCMRPKKSQGKPGKVTITACPSVCPAPNLVAKKEKKKKQLKSSLKLNKNPYLSI